METKITTINTGPFGVNTYIVSLWENHVLVVDSAACSLTCDENKVISHLKNRSLKPVMFLHTHGHFDHVMGSAVLKKAWPNVPLCVHKEDEGMCGVNAAQVQGSSLAAMGLKEIAKGLEGLAPADILFEGGETLLSAMEAKGLLQDAEPELKASLVQWKVLHTPGHTKGCVCFYNESEKILLSGDTVFYHSWGRTDLDGGDEGQMMKSLVYIKNNVVPDAKVYPGHDYNGFMLAEGL